MPGQPFSLANLRAVADALYGKRQWHRENGPQARKPLATGVTAVVSLCRITSTQCPNRSPNPETELHPVPQPEMPPKAAQAIPATTITRKKSPNIELNL
jgi:hypothetical protein